jgi:putative transposon-encoded protein
MEKFIIRIYFVYTMKKVPIVHENHLEVYNISGYFTRTVTKFGNSAKIDCPKEYLGRKVIVVVL